MLNQPFTPSKWSPAAQLGSELSSCSLSKNPNNFAAESLEGEQGLRADLKSLNSIFRGVGMKSHPSDRGTLVTEGMGALIFNYVEVLSCHAKWNVSRRNWAVPYLLPLLLAVISYVQDSHLKDTRCRVKLFCMEKGKISDLLHFR